MTYIIQRSNPATQPFQIADGTLNTTSCSISLPGRNYAGYGLPVDQDLVRMLENFSSPSIPQYGLQGQLWFDTVGNVDYANLATTSGILRLNIQDQNLSNTTNPNLWIPILTNPVPGDLQVNGNLVVFGTTTFGANIPSISTITGAIILPGTSGIGLGGNLNAGGNINVSSGSPAVAYNDIDSAIHLTGTGGISLENGNVWIGSPQTSTSATTGALVVAGGVGIGGDVNIQGNLNVEGNATYINVETISVEDPLLQIGGGPNGAPAPAASASWDRGFLMHNYRGGAAVNDFMGWKSSDGGDGNFNEFQLKNGVTVATANAANIVTGGTYANLRVGNLFGNFAGALANGLNFSSTGNGNISPFVYNANSAVSNNVISFNTVGAAQSANTNPAATNIGYAIGISNPANTIGMDPVTGNIYGNWIFPANITAATPNTTLYGNWLLGAGATFQATYADLAERHHSDGEYPLGTVMKVGGENEITAAGDGEVHDVLGVVSKSYAYLMNSGAGDDSTHPAIALAGRIVVRVVGSIKKGDRLVPTQHGCAKRSDTNSGFGWALEDNIDTNEKLVLCVIK